MEVLWFLIDNWPLTLAIIGFCYLLVWMAEDDGVLKALKKSRELRKKVEKELDD